MVDSTPRLTRPAISTGALDPLMERWVRDNIPEWQRILREAEAKGQERRAAYARWMLAEVLASPLAAAQFRERKEKHDNRTRSGPGGAR